MVSDKKAIDLGNIFKCEVFIGVDSDALPVDTVGVPRHTIDYFLHQMRLAIYVGSVSSLIEECMSNAGYYVLLIPRDRAEARTVAKRFARTVYWTSDDNSGQGIYGLHEPKLFGDVGHDLTSVGAVTIPAKGFELIDANVRLQLPPTVFGWITARSSTARRLLMVPNGIIDAGYRGPLFAHVLNMTDEAIHVQAGDRVAQIIFQSRIPIDIEYADQFWMPSERSTNGFGSTGR